MKLLDQLTATTPERGLEVPNGLSLTVTANGISADTIEIKCDPDLSATPFDITDSTDPVDATKKVVNAANNTRVIHGPITVSLHRVGSGDSGLLPYFAIQ